MNKIAALFVETNGCYYGIDGVDPWDINRDARKYCGIFPVVAHPPCARWCMLAGLVEARYGHKRGDDNGCFESALNSVRRVGGVLEHPAYSKAWEKFGIARPPSLGGWVKADEVGGFTCQVSQINYGHKSRKATWLYVNKTSLPDMIWGFGPKPSYYVSNCANNTKIAVDRLSKKQSNATPIKFRDILIEMARSVYR